MPSATSFDLYIIEVVDRVLPPELAGMLRMVILGSPPPQPAPEGITHRRPIMVTSPHTIPIYFCINISNVMF
ncbi:hypothetical protein QE152_g40473 [Popillia japonica]|uniref:Uncharacterized protein n=1 Tax=Popillia japonica TaxID=7064 RepID=A0AAW1HHK2_POPJA